jgi:hypothetical protein
MTDESTADRDRAVAAAVASVTGARSVSRRVVAAGHTAAVRQVHRLADGRTVFAKAAFEPRTLEWLRAEWRIYSAVDASFLPDVYGWVDAGDHAVLLLENLSDGVWPTGWTAEAVYLVRDALRQVNATRPPPGLPALADHWPPRDSGWRAVGADPRPFLSLGLCSAGWLDRHLPALLAAERSAPVDGESLVHFDVRSDNVCLLPRRAVLVDWNWAARANPLIDLVGWMPSLAAEGGPPPEDQGPGTAELTVLCCGFWASRAGAPPPPGGPGVRQLQRRQLEVALPWACELLGLSPPG